jgi:hypothetical protein
MGCCETRAKNTTAVAIQISLRKFGSVTLPIFIKDDHIQALTQCEMLGRLAAAACTKDCEGFRHTGHKEPLGGAGNDGIQKTTGPNTACSISKGLEGRY